MKGPFEVALHPAHPNALERDRDEWPADCDCASVTGIDDDGFRRDVCTTYVEGSQAFAQRIADALNAHGTAEEK